VGGLEQHVVDLVLQELEQPGLEHVQPGHEAGEAQPGQEQTAGLPVQDFRDECHETLTKVRLMTPWNSSTASLIFIADARFFQLHGI
jgi:hypothetical protein